MSLDENDLEVRVLEIERRLNWAIDAIRGIVRRQNAGEQQIGAIGMSMGIIQSPSVLGGLSPAVSGAGGIVARSGSTPGSATITLQVLTGGTLSTGGTVTCFNPNTTAVAGSKNLVVGQDTQGNYWVVSEDCT